MDATGLKINRLKHDQRGAVVLIFALGLPVMIGLPAAAIMYNNFVSEKQKLQTAADSASIAVVSDMRISNSNQSRIEAVAKSVVSQQLPVTTDASAVNITVSKVFPAASQVNISTGTPTGATIALSRTINSVIRFFPGMDNINISATATAKFSGSNKVCVVSLDDTAADSVHLKDIAKIEAKDCSVYANSKNAGSVRAEGASLITSGSLCTAGGFSGSTVNYLPPPATDCPPVKDPLIARPAPPVGGCDYTNTKLIGVTKTLSPGTYCGGLVVDKGAQVMLNPGVYVIKDGPLIVGPGGLTVTTQTAATQNQQGNNNCQNNVCTTTTTLNTGYMRGTNVGFYFTGTVAPDSSGISRPMRFMKDSLVELTAPLTGPLAGLLFFEDRAAAPDRLYEVISDSARKLVGTIYIPRGTFSVSSNQSVADLSEYTAVVVKRLDLSQGPRLVVNTNYFATDVPVPDGIGPYSGHISLTQ